jgi:prephenate dehydrogenase
MAAQITIIGLGQIGASIGMALKEKKTSLRRVGVEKDSGVARAAETLGVVDQIKGLPDAVKEADIVLLCLPLGEMRAMLQKVGMRLKENAILMDTAPVKGSMVEWVKAYLPAGRYYIGLVPAVTMDAVSAPEMGFKAARPDLFKNTVMIVDAPPGTPFEVEQLAMNLVRMLDAKPMLADIAESDGLMTTAHLLPQLTSAALLDATIDRPGWAEARKVAGRPFVGVTGGLAYYDDPASLKEAALANRPAVVHALDVLMASLKGLRDDIEKGDEAGLKGRLGEAFEARERWLDERVTAEWLKEGGDALELPELGEQILQTLFGNRVIDRVKPKKK